VGVKRSLKERAPGDAAGNLEGEKGAGQKTRHANQQLNDKAPQESMGGRGNGRELSIGEPVDCWQEK